MGVGVVVQVVGGSQGAPKVGRETPQHGQDLAVVPRIYDPFPHVRRETGNVLQRLVGVVRVRVPCRPNVAGGASTQTHKHTHKHEKKKRKKRKKRKKKREAACRLTKKKKSEIAVVSKVEKKKKKERKSWLWAEN